MGRLAGGLLVWVFVGERDEWVSGCGQMGAWPRTGRGEMRVCVGAGTGRVAVG